MTFFEKAGQWPRLILPLVAVTLIGCLGGCEYKSDDVSLPSASTSSSSVHTPSPPPEGVTRPVPPLPKSGDIDAGTYVVPVAGYGEPFEITVPDGWLALDGDSLGKDDPDHPAEWAVYLTLWPANYVSMDACKWMGALADVGPSADAFVSAMAAQTSTASTPPVKVRVGNYFGLEFDHFIEGDVDISGCDAGKLCIQRIGTPAHGGTRLEANAKPTAWSSSTASGL
ncbi:hypothetical protein [Pseudarthrobacter chlorophenolicus]|uniref:hypothetical protein n=1 Tax=Pseudarthrobacter chlorophenolicus TaxID=85085 RepID=UPI001F208889|nr:hypothetical protein [Pseudarthrobacter chlorophenolicus]